MSDIKLIDNTPLFRSAMQRAVENGLTAIGMTAETYAKKEITANDNVVTGRLRSSITFAISGEGANIDSYSDDEGNTYTYEGKAPDDKQKAVYIGTNVEYAPYVELGTSRSPAYPFLRPAAADHGPEYRRIMEAALKSAE